jgi:hypothetical protein
VRNEKNAQVLVVEFVCCLKIDSRTCGEVDRSYSKDVLQYNGFVNNFIKKYLVSRVSRAL